VIFDSPSKKDAVDLLKEDHRKVESLFRQFESADDNARKVELAQTICAELTVHAQIEEQIFYPAAREALPEDKQDLVSEATVEHTSLKKLIADIDGSSPNDELFEANVKVLSEYVKHHVREEENEMMPAVRGTDLDLEALGERLARRKQALQEAQQRNAGRGDSKRVRVPMTRRKTTGRKRAATGRKRVAAAKTSRTQARKSARKSGGRSAASKPRSRAAATRKRAGARAPSRRSTRGR